MDRRAARGRARAWSRRQGDARGARARGRARARPFRPAGPRARARDAAPARETPERAPSRAPPRRGRRRERHPRRSGPPAPAEKEDSPPSSSTRPRGSAPPRGPDVFDATTTSPERRRRRTHPGKPQREGTRGRTRRDRRLRAGTNPRLAILRRSPSVGLDPSRSVVPPTAGWTTLLLRPGRHQHPARHPVVGTPWVVGTPGSSAPVAVPAGVPARWRRRDAREGRALARRDLASDRDENAPGKPPASGSLRFISPARPGGAAISRSRRRRAARGRGERRTRPAG